MTFRGLSYFAFFFGLTVVAGMASAQTPGDSTYYWGRVGGAGGQAYHGIGNTAIPHVRPSYGSTKLVNQFPGTFQLSPDGSGGVTLKAQRPIRVPSVTGSNVLLAERVKIAAPEMARQAVSVARAIPAIGAFVAVPIVLDLLTDYLTDDGISYDEPLQQWVKEGAGPRRGDAEIVHPGAAHAYYNDITIDSFDSLQSAALLNSGPRATCLQNGNTACVNDNTPDVVIPAGSCSRFGVTGERYTMRTVLGTTKGSICTFPGPTENRPATDSEMYEAWRNGNGPLPDDPMDAVDLLGIVHTAGLPIDLSQQDAEVDLPAEPIVQPVSTSTTTTTNADGTTSARTTTTTNTTNITNNTNTTNNFSEQTINTTTTTTTVVTENGQEVERTETEQPRPEEEEQEEQQDLSFTDPAFPEIEIPYEQRYPDGIVGVWNTKKDELSGTQFVTSVSAMFPSISGAGTCPQWQLPINFSFFNYGTGDVSVACWIWDVVGLLMITFACFAARDIIFGRG